MRFNGSPIQQLDPEWYHNQIAIVQQEPVLFSGSIRENITYGMDLKDKSKDEIEAMMNEATQKASAHFIHDRRRYIPLSYETMVGKHGVELSGGQK